MTVVGVNKSFDPEAIAKILIAAAFAKLEAERKSRMNTAAQSSRLLVVAGPTKIWLIAKAAHGIATVRGRDSRPRSDMPR